MKSTDLTQERLAHLVRSLSSQFRRELEHRLEEHGVPFGHWVFLRILWEEEGLYQRELAQRSGLTSPTVHTAVTKMEEIGLIERRVPEGNAVRPVVYLTKRGRAMREILEPIAISVNEHATQDISDRDLRVTTKTILKMTARLSGKL